MDHDIKDKGLIKMASPFDDGPIKMYIKSANDKTVTVDVEPGETVRSLKIKVQTMEKIPSGQKRLMLVGTILDNAKTLRDYCPPPNGVMSLGSGEESVEEKRRRSSISRKFGGQAALTLTLIRTLTLTPTPTLEPTLTRTLTCTLTLTRRRR
jgi:hypothetical protein